MEKPENKLEVFSPLLLKNHIRLLAVANCITAENANIKTDFIISPENYQNMMSDELQAPLIGIVLQYDEKTQRLSAGITQDVYDMYANKIMREVALVYKENYFHRYDNFIICPENAA